MSLRQHLQKLATRARSINDTAHDAIAGRITDAEQETHAALQIALNRVQLSLQQMKTRVHLETSLPPTATAPAPQSDTLIDIVTQHDRELMDDPRVTTLLAGPPLEVDGVVADETKERYLQTEDLLQDITGIEVKSDGILDENSMTALTVAAQLDNLSDALEAPVLDRPPAASTAQAVGGHTKGSELNNN